MNAYDKELFKFNNMLDEYYIKFNAQPLKLDKEHIEDYYSAYFDIKLYKDNVLTKDAHKVMEDYFQGLLWVFDYYFNLTDYVNTWYYPYERAPLMTHLLEYLDSIKQSDVDKLFDGLDEFHVEKLKSYWNPVEQLIYVSPLIEDTLQLIPVNYREFLRSDEYQKYIKKHRDIFPDIVKLVDDLWSETKSKDFDCRGIIFFNKCQIKTLERPTSEEDIQYLKILKDVEPSEVSKRRSKNGFPNF